MWSSNFWNATRVPPNAGVPLMISVSEAGTIALSSLRNLNEKSRRVRTLPFLQDDALPAFERILRPIAQSHHSASTLQK
jgi:hypothetical protein